MSDDPASGETPVRIHYDFKLLDQKESSFFLQKEMKESLRQWGMEDTLTLVQAHFCPAFMPHEETAFICQLLSFAADKTAKAQSPLATAHGVRWESLKCTAMSMEFFNCLVEKGIVSQSGNIRGCFPDVLEGVTVSDKLRELLVNPDSENADVFSADQQQELLFHVFRALSVGGGVCQPDDSLEPYTKATRALYKDLISVQKNSSTGKLEIAACKVYRVTSGLFSGDQDSNPHHHHHVNDDLSMAHRGGGAVGDNFTWRNTAPQPSPHCVCLVVIDLFQRRASVLRKEFLPFW